MDIKPFSFFINTNTPTTSVFTLTSTTQSTTTTFSTLFSSPPSTVQSSFSFSLNGTKPPVESTKTSSEFQQPAKASFSFGPSIAPIDDAFSDSISKPSFKMGVFGTTGSTQPLTELSFGIAQKSINPLNENESSAGTAQTSSNLPTTPTTNSSSKDSSFLSDFQSPKSSMFGGSTTPSFGIKQESVNPFSNENKSSAGTAQSTSNFSSTPTTNSSSKDSSFLGYFQSPKNSMFGGSSPSPQATFLNSFSTQSEPPKFSIFDQSTKTTNNLFGSISSQSESNNSAPSFLFKPTTTFSDLAATNKQSPFISGK